MKTNNNTIPALSSPGKRTAPSAGNQGRGYKYADGKQTAKKIRGRKKTKKKTITTGT